MPPNIESPDGAMGKSLPGSWVVGNAQTDTPITNLQSGLLYPYINSVGVYRCPADRSTVRGQPGVPRLRSYSLDCWLNNDATLSGFPPSGFFPYLKRRLSELRNPVEVFNFIDEHEQTIDQGSFIVVFPQVANPAGNANKWADMPSDRHNQGASVGFADGHGMPWHWTAPKIKHQPPLDAEDLKDLRRMQIWVPRE